MNFKFSLIPFLLLSITIYGQGLEVNDIKINEKGIVSFTCFVSPHHSKREVYDLEIYTSKDFFKSPIDMKPPVIKVGVSEYISFNGNEIIGDYDGFITFKFGLKPTVFPVEITSEKKKFKRGKQISIEWDDYQKMGKYNVLLCREDSVYYSLGEGVSDMSITTEIPKKIPKGDYQLRIVPTSNQLLASDDYLVSVKAQSNGLIIGTGLVSGGLIYLIVSGEEDSLELPTPPKFPSN